MAIERETVTKIFATPHGSLTVKSVYRIHREHHSGTNQVVNKQRESVNLVADGDWLTEDMANDLMAALLGKAAVPSWLALSGDE